MKGNYESLVAMATEIERIEEAKNDFIVPATNLVMPDDNTIGIQNGNRTDYQMTDYMHGQMATKLGIPKNYYDRMIEVPALRQTNVNSWLNHESMENKRFMIRTIDNKARALLSDKFKTFDNMLVLQSFLPAVKEHGNLEIMSSSMTDTKMYLQLKFPKLQGEVTPGDVVQSGIVLTNSEVGAGSVDVKTMTWRLVCTNGMIASSVIRKNHVGRRAGGDFGDNFDLYEDDTILAELNAFKLKLRDILKDALSAAKFQDQLSKMRKAVDDKIVDLPKTIENVTKRWNLTEATGRKVLTNIVADGHGSNRWSLANGITALAHDIESPDIAYGFEKMGQQIIDVPEAEWREIVA